MFGKMLLMLGVLIEFLSTNYRMTRDQATFTLGHKLYRTPEIKKFLFPN